MGGNPKPLLPFGDSTVLEHILSALLACQLDEVVVVTGYRNLAITRLVAQWPVRIVFNPDYASGEMLSSIQVGLESASADSDAALIALGDQPALEAQTIRQVTAAYGDGRGSIVIPSYHMRRGHPILIARKHWPSILALKEGQTLRDFMREVNSEIYHVDVSTPTILRDMDTPEDYARELAGYAPSPHA